MAVSVDELVNKLNQNKKLKQLVYKCYRLQLVMAMLQNIKTDQYTDLDFQYKRIQLYCYEQGDSLAEILKQLSEDSLKSLQKNLKKQNPEALYQNKLQSLNDKITAKLNVLKSENQAFQKFKQQFFQNAELIRDDNLIYYFYLLLQHFTPPGHDMIKLSQKAASIILGLIMIYLQDVKTTLFTMGTTLLSSHLQFMRLDEKNIAVKFPWLKREFVSLISLLLFKTYESFSQQDFAPFAYFLFGLATGYGLEQVVNKITPQKEKSIWQTPFYLLTRQIGEVIAYYSHQAYNEAQQFITSTRDFIKTYFSPALTTVNIDSLFACAIVILSKQLAFSLKVDSEESIAYYGCNMELTETMANITCREINKFLLLKQ